MLEGENKLIIRHQFSSSSSSSSSPSPSSPSSSSSPIINHQHYCSTGPPLAGSIVPRLLPVARCPVQRTDHGGSFVFRSSIYLYLSDRYRYTYIYIYITLHDITLHYMTLHYITLHYITSHTLHTWLSI